VAEVLVQFTDPVIAQDGRVFMARACGSEADDGLWQGWIEFVPVGEGEVLRSRRETTQPNRADAVYWATGLTNVFLEGSLERTLRPATRATALPDLPAAFDGPAPEPASAAPGVESVLNPFSVYRKGEPLLRSQLAALSPWHLVNIVRAHHLSDIPAADLNTLPGAALIEIIVEGVRSQAVPGER
jgi:hypothetical protein